MLTHQSRFYFAQTSLSLYPQQPNSIIWWCNSVGHNGHCIHLSTPVRTLEDMQFADHNTIQLLPRSSLFGNELNDYSPIRIYSIITNRKYKAKTMVWFHLARLFSPSTYSCLAHLEYFSRLCSSTSLNSHRRPCHSTKTTLSQDKLGAPKRYGRASATALLRPN